MKVYLLMFVGDLEPGMEPGLAEGCRGLNEELAWNVTVHATRELAEQMAERAGEGDPPGFVWEQVEPQQWHPGFAGRAWMAPVHGWSRHVSSVRSMWTMGRVVRCRS